MNASVSSEKKNVKESQSRNVTSSLDTPSSAGLGVSQFSVSEQRFRRFWNFLNIDRV